MLASCAGFLGSTPPPVLPDRCDPAALAEVPDAPAIPDGAGFPQPITPAEREAVAAYLTWLAAYGDSDTLVRERLRLIRKGCLTKDKANP